MGFYIRKSVRVGPLRFNLSKSGIGVSTGIRGFRVGSGPRGNYIHMGRGGFYYRQTLSSPTPRSEDFVPPAVEQPKPRVLTHGPMNEIGSGCVTEMVDTTSASLLAEIERKSKQITWWPFMLAASLILGILLIATNVSLWLAIPFIASFLIATLFLHQFDQLQKSVVLMYELDGPQGERTMPPLFQPRFLAGSHRSNWRSGGVGGCSVCRLYVA